MLRALVCGGQGLFDYSANPPRLCVVLGPLGSDLEALSEICRGGGPRGGAVGDTGSPAGALLAQRLVRAPSLSPG